MLVQSTRACAGLMCCTHKLLSVLGCRAACVALHSGVRHAPHVAPRRLVLTHMTPLSFVLSAHVCLAVCVHPASIVCLACVSRPAHGV